MYRGIKRGRKSIQGREQIPSREGREGRNVDNYVDNLSKMLITYECVYQWKCQIYLSTECICHISLPSPKI
jgi:hypothetical protein